MLQAHLSASRTATLTLVGATAFLLFWSAAALSGVTSRTFLPAPWDVVTRFAQLTVEPFAGYTLFQHLLSSFQRFASAAIVLATPRTEVRSDVAMTAGAVRGATFAEARVVIATRCVSCHSAAPTDGVFTAAPTGVAFDTPEQMVRMASRIRERAVIQRTMPFANRTGITDGEREILRRWIESGARLR